MAKIIKLTPECLEVIRKDFEDVLKSAKLSDGRITYSRSFGAIQRHATVYFEEIAWIKMQTLIREFDKEVAWHGVAVRGDDPEKNEYIIKDILVYPQEVTGATVTTDQAKYQTWLMEQDDEIFNDIRMQGHSHVNMSTSPSSVDTALYEKILDQLDDTMFYIFLIYNKRGEKTYKIYDMAKNVLFETADVEVKVMDDGIGLEKFISDAKSMVKEHTYITGTGFAGKVSSVYNQTPKTPAQAFPTTQKQEQKTEDKKESKNGDKKSDGKRKGKRKEQSYGTGSSLYYGKSYYGYDYDYDGCMSGYFGY